MAKIDDIIEGEVVGVESYGIFVKVDDSTNGLIHISEISDKYVKDPADFAKIGEKIKAKVIGIKETGDLNLTIKEFNYNKNGKKRKYIKETATGFKTLAYKLPFWIEENLKKHKKTTNSIDK